ncbi:hypothetical protein LTR08_001836 [Meristemomyces frigidus]|nr:hypothetical protein LTR08_001836 [Meristemomyces frigidus]
MASSDIYSVRRIHDECDDYGYSFNFGDLLPDLPYTAFNVEAESPDCSIPRNMPYPNWPCDTIIDWAYFPTLVVPTEIRTLDPAWASCAVNLNGLYDPPKFLSAATTEAGVSQPGVQTSTAASPASTPSHAAASPTAPTTSGQVTPAAESTMPEAPAAQSTASGAQTSPASPAGANSEDPTSASGQDTSTISSGQHPAQGTSSGAGEAAQSTETADIGNAGGAVASILGNTASSASNTEPAPQSLTTPDGAASTAAGGDVGSGKTGGATSIADPGQSAASTLETSRQDATTIVSSVLGGSSTSTSGGYQAAPSQDPGASTATPAAVVGAGGHTSDAEASSLSLSGDNQVNGGSSLQSTFVFTAQGSTHTGSPIADSSGIYAVDGSTVSIGGSAVVVNGATLSAGDSVLLVDGTPVAVSSDQAAHTQPVVLTADGAPYTASPVSGSNGHDDIDGTTLAPSSPAVVISGAVVSAALSGLVVDGTPVASDPDQTAGSSPLVITANGATYTASPVPSSSGYYAVESTTLSPIAALSAASGSSGAVMTIGSSIISAAGSVVTGNNGQLTTEAIVGGSSLMQGGSHISISGHTVFLGPGGIVVDGTQTQQLTALSATSASLGVAFTLGSSTLSAVQTVFTGSNSQRTTEAIIDGSTLVRGGSPVTIQGHTLSFGSSGVVVDETQTQQLSVVDASVTGAIISVDSSTLSAIEAVITGSNGQVTTEAIIQGGTLLQDGVPLTLAGHTFSLGSDRQVVVDGTRTQSLSVLGASSITASDGDYLASVVFTEHGSTFTATPAAGKTGVYVVDGRTLSASSSDVVVDGITLSAQSTGLVVDGSQTVAFTGTQSRSVGASSQTTAPSSVDAQAPTTGGQTTTSGSDGVAALPRAICLILVAVTISVLV